MTAPTLHPGGHLVRVARERAGISRPELAKRLGVSAERVHAIESGRSPLTEETLARVAAALGCELVLRIRKPRAKVTADSG